MSQDVGLASVKRVGLLRPKHPWARGLSTEGANRRLLGTCFWRLGLGVQGHLRLADWLKMFDWPDLAVIHSLPARYRVARLRTDAGGNGLMRKKPK